MYCACCGNDLGEEQLCGGCSWSFGKVDIPDKQLIQPSPGEGAAVTSLVCGVLSWMTHGVFAIVPIVGIISGIMGLKSRQSEIAVVGIIINAINVAVLTLYALLIFCIE